MVRMTTRGALRAEVLSPIILASGIDLTDEGRSVVAKPIKTQAWQNTAWNFHDTVPAYRYGVQWVGNLLSKATLVVLENGKPTQNQKALDALASFYGGVDQQGECLRQCGLHMTVAGEFYIASWDDGEDEIWQVVASTEIKSTTQGWKITGEEVDPILVMRGWRPHPKKPKLSDSPTRALLSTLAELENIGKYTSAELESRLTGAGILFLPTSLDFPTITVTNPDGSTSQQPGTPSTFIKYLYDVMSAAKRNPESAAARVPILLQADGEDIDKIKWQTFWSELDEHIPAMEEAATTKLATGMDMPPEVLKGTAEMNHWNAWQSEEASIKAHTEPLLALITAALTTGYLRPFLEGGNEGMTKEEAAAFTIGADTSKMRLRPNKSKEAIELYDRGELSAAAMLRENGFEVTDAMDEKELPRWLARKLALGAGSATPGQLAAVARVLGGLDLPVDELGGEDEEPREATRTLEEHPRRDPPELPASAGAEVAALLAASEVLVFRALERAGNKLKTRFKESQRPDDVAARDLYRFLPLTEEDVTYAVADSLDGIAQFTTSLNVDAHQLKEALRKYVTILLAQGAEHDPGLLRRHLASLDRE